MIPKAFSYSFHVRLHDTDAAGRLFFAHLFRHAHDAYESFMAHLGLPLEHLIAEGQVLLPLVHAEADYHHPLAQGDSVAVSLVIEEMRTRSFAVRYHFETANGVKAATARTVHIQIQGDGRPVARLSGDITSALRPYLVPGSEQT
jgi:1,4-dihydroxy-2-naphthoyl-CoA hydrolase